ncbi:unnamed protein product [Vitrella brassicaformis CCMP3155]|uniref:Uncharacterized protein n=1 Tax=Vitrella brassicaformis (strain CCMP3155) TaxID=1169540 RepID=A0A0G4FSH3_VITBC|nr:unnamed protein product [Vitrella brassicaformis CCMP3155]|eukprot:CEM17646.1 unnamed protein product [Vitrella brassicaformis CCMP3155]
MVKRAATTILRKFFYAPKEPAEVIPSRLAYTFFEDGLLSKLSPLLISPDEETRENAANVLASTLLSISSTIHTVPESQPAILETIIDAGILPNARAPVLPCSGSEGVDMTAEYMLTHLSGCALLIREGNETQQIYAADQECTETLCMFARGLPSRGSFLDTLIADSFTSLLSGNLRQQAKATILRTGGCKEWIEEAAEDPIVSDASA